MSFHDAKVVQEDDSQSPKQSVVQEALLTILHEWSYFSWFTPIANMTASAEDAEMATKKTPESATYLIAAAPHLMLAGSHSFEIDIAVLLMTNFLFFSVVEISMCRITLKHV